MILPERLQAIGRFQRTHALRGELNAQLEVDDEFLVANPWVIVDMEGIPTPFRVESVRPKGATTSLLKLRGVDTEEQARVFVNREVQADAAFVAEWIGDEGEGMYAADFIGYNLSDTDGDEVGTITGVNLSSEDNPLFEVSLPDSRIVLVPVADELIESYDPDAGTIVMNIPTGLLDL